MREGRIIMVALRRTEQYKTIRHHLRDTRLYDMTRTAPALIHMFHTSGRDLWLRTPTPDSILKNTTGPGPLTPPTDYPYPGGHHPPRVRLQQASGKPDRSIRPVDRRFHGRYQELWEGVPLGHGTGAYGFRKPGL